ncbi:Dabb family protein [Prosthecomicrobium sp. N25]|uniref:Dabb family protein n=1 Tax=Prosthecomicrobium sp. N25 TaxID=3129254 RepID=UPI0030771766
MIRHIVLVKFRPEVTEAEIAAVFADLEPIRALVPGIGPIVAGRSESPEKIERGYRHGFTIDFDTWEALAAYQEHPAHKAVGARLVAGAVGGIDGICVLDIPFG